jgi:hypothetical protein
MQKSGFVCSLSSWVRAPNIKAQND